MKITFLNSTDTGGGAANACKRQAEALYRNGADITFLSQKHKGETKPYSRYYIKNKFDKGLYFIRHLLNERLLKKYPAIQHNNFSAGYYGAAVENHPDIKNADIVHIHWMNDSFLTPETIRKIAKQGKKIVWTLHDMWSFTGGCHYAGRCKKYMQHCGECPVLQSKKEEDISFKQLTKKQEAWEGIAMNIITPSHWLGGCSKESNLFSEYNHHVIRYALDTEVFHQLDKTSLRAKFNIDPNKKIILFGAVNATKDVRKGFKYLVEALKILHAKNLPFAKDIELAIFGSSGDDSLQLPFKTHFLGNLKTDAAIVEAYNLADVFATPSLEDNLPNTVFESMACGVPVVGFRIGGIPEMIDHHINGYTADPLSSESLADGLAWIMEDADRYKKLSASGRDKIVREYDYKLIASQHIELYKRIMKG